MMNFQTAAQARTYILAHDDEARALNRKPRHELAAIERSELETRNTYRLIGVLSKDELIASILGMRYPHVAQARAAYYADHQWPPGSGAVRA